VWKDEGKVAETRGRKPWRVLCELLAKLLGQLVQHWATLLAGSPLEVSGVKAARRVRQRAARLAEALGVLPALVCLLERLQQRLRRFDRKRGRTKMRNAGLEVSLYRGDFPRASSASLAEMLLLGRLTTASQAAIRAETQLRVQEALNAMDSIDREVLVLRHFEMLSNEETAQVLGLKPSAASNRHVRALRRLKESMAQVPGPGGGSPGP
jgi:RNA polymerase sigma factor (sigma-70 family)